MILFDSLKVVQQPQNKNWVFTKQRLNDRGVEHQGGETLFPEGLSLKNVTDLVITLLQNKFAIAQVALPFSCDHVFH